MSTRDSQSARIRRPPEVVLFDSARPWTAYLMRELVRQGFHPKLHRAATGLDLIDWSTTFATIVDIADARPGSPRTHYAAAALWHLTDRYPGVIRIAIADTGNPTQWLLREAGAVAIYHSVFDVGAMASLLQRCHQAGRPG